jgi:hypothetical protein
MKYNKPKTKRKYHRSGTPTKTEKKIAEKLIEDAKGLITPQQEKALARVFNRPVGTVKKILTDARANLQKDAEFYVNAHRQSVEDALATNQVDVARKGAAWAIERISGEGKRLVDKPDAGPASPVNVMVGVRLGNVTMQPEVTLNAIEGEVED